MTVPLSATSGGSVWAALLGAVDNGDKGGQGAPLELVVRQFVILLIHGKLTLLISPSSPHPYIYYKTHSHARARSHQLHASRGARTPHLGRHWSNHRETNSPSFARHRVTPRYLSAMAIACNPVARRAHIPSWTRRLAKVAKNSACWDVDMGSSTDR